MTALLYGERPRGNRESDAGSATFFAAGRRVDVAGRVAGCSGADRAVGASTGATAFVSGAAWHVNVSGSAGCGTTAPAAGAGGAERGADITALPMFETDEAGP
ncbi:hypothetical protein [Streptomyces collinus]|uniref:hypothetical protein n=1 Tax=Streptomyces collinus TaxID=42684 RepID=UPI0037B1BDEC